MDTVLVKVRPAQNGTYEAVECYIYDNGQKRWGEVVRSDFKTAEAAREYAEAENKRRNP